MGKWAKNGPEIGFFKFIGKFGHYFFLNLFYNERLYYLMCSCTQILYLGKIWPIRFHYFKSTIFLEQNDEEACCIFRMLIQVHGN